VPDALSEAKPSRRVDGEGRLGGKSVKIHDRRWVVIKSMVGERPKKRGEGGGGREKREERKRNWGKRQKRKEMGVVQKGN